MPGPLPGIAVFAVFMTLASLPRQPFRQHADRTRQRQLHHLHWFGQVCRLEQAIGNLNGAIVFAAALGIGFSAWNLSLFPYSEAYTLPSGDGDRLRFLPDARQ